MAQICPLMELIVGLPCRMHPSLHKGSGLKVDSKTLFLDFFCVVVCL